MSSSSSRVSSNVYSGYNLVAVVDQESLRKNQITPSRLLQVFLVVIQAKLPDGSTTEYSMKEVKDTIAIFSKDKDKKTMVELGWNKKRGFLYTDHTSSSKFQDKLKQISHLSQDNVNNLRKRNRTCIIPSTKEQILVLATLEYQSFTSPFFAMQKSHPKEFVSLPRTRPVMTKAVPSSSTTTLGALFTNLFAHNKGVGFFFQFGFFKEGFTEFLTHMVFLKTMGVKHIYDETPACILYPDYEKFNEVKDCDGSELHECLKNIGDQAHENRMRIYKKAKSLDIQIWPIDNLATHQPTLNDRITIGGETIIRNIDYYSSMLRENEKFFTLNGSGQYYIGDRIGIPTILLNNVIEETEESNDVKKAGISPEELKEDMVYLEAAVIASLVVPPGSQSFQEEISLPSQTREKQKQQVSETSNSMYEDMLLKPEMVDAIDGKGFDFILNFTGNDVLIQQRSELS